MRIFLSYSHDDFSLADQVQSVFEASRVEVFRDINNIEWGESIRSRVSVGLSEVDAVVLILSPGSVKSQWVAFEVGFAFAMGKPILPFLSHPALDLPKFLGDPVYVNSVEEIRNKLKNDPQTLFARLSQTHRAPAASQRSLFLRTREAMAELLNKMRENLISDPYVREFFVLPNRRVSLGGSIPKRWVFYDEDHPNLLDKVRILEERGFVRDVTVGNTPIFRITDDFASFLREPDADGDTT